MQLVDIENSKPEPSADLVKSVHNSDFPDLVIKQLQTDSLDAVFKELFVLAVRSDNPVHLLVFTDALHELLTRVYPDQPEYLLRAAASFFAKYSYKPIDTSALLFGVDDLPQAVVVGNLEFHILNGENESALKSARDILYAAESPGYLNELLLQTAVSIQCKDADQLVLTNIITKILKLNAWKNCNEYVAFIVNHLANAGAQSRLLLNLPENTNINYADILLSVSEKPGENGNNFLVASHLRQIYKSAVVLSSRVHPKLAYHLNCFVPPGSVSPDHFYPTGTNNELAKAIREKDRRSVLFLINQYQQSKTDANRVLREVLNEIPNLAGILSPHKIIFLNSARRIAVTLGYPRNMRTFESIVDTIFTYMENIQNDN